MSTQQPRSRNQNPNTFFFLVSDFFLQNTVLPEVSIKDGYLSDHQMITLNVNMQSKKFGRSFWKFNNSLLLDDVFIEEAKAKINEIIDDNATADSACLLLETVLWVLRGWIIQFATHKKRMRNKRLLELEKEINALHCRSTAVENQRPA